MKAIIVQGCKDCPYLIETDPLSNLGGCKLFEFMFDLEIPETPHPNCKLNDLPTPNEISDYAHENIPTSYDYDLGKHNGFHNGANWIIEQITK